jgi:hypothetical protein
VRVETYQPFSAIHRSVHVLQCIGRRQSELFASGREEQMSKTGDVISRCAPLGACVGKIERLECTAGKLPCHLQSARSEH